jgi:hypothetical protein
VPGRPGSSRPAARLPPAAWRRPPPARGCASRAGRRSRTPRSAPPPAPAPRGGPRGPAGRRRWTRRRGAARTPGW